MVPSGSSTSMLNNKWILYFMLFISVVDLFNFYSMGDMSAIAIFLVTGFLTSYFSKNMLVILVIAIAVAHIARYGSASLEGMEGEEAEDEEEEEEEDVTAEDEEGLETEEDSKAKTELKNIDESLKTIQKIHPDEIADQTKTLIEQTKKVQENMALLEPYLKAAEKATEPLKSEGFCDYASAFTTMKK
jgi:flagellar motility protein MotE (MotC chaperone)